MTRMTTGISIRFIVAIVNAISSDAQGQARSEEFASPRLAALAQQLTGDAVTDHSMIDDFWEERQGNGPLVEPVADDPHSLWVTFLWRGDSQTRRVNVQGGPSTGESAGWMTALGSTDLWYRTDRFPDDSRFVYLFQVNRPLKFPRGDDEQGPLVPPRPDPLNRHTLSTQDASLLELPAAPPQPWLEKVAGLAQGKLLEHSIHSEILKQERTFTVYTPPSYEPADQAYSLLVLFDGEDYQREEHIPGPVILDNLIHGKNVRPLVAVFVHQFDRNKELTCSESFASFVARELVPWVRTHYHVSAEPDNTIIGGSSFGGLMAAYCAFRHCDVFGNVLSVSGAYQWFPGADGKPVLPDVEPGWLTRKYVTAPRVPVRFFLSAGRFEHRYPVSLLAENRRLRDVLQAKGCAVTYCEFSGGHDPICWRSPFVDGLMALAGLPPQE